MPKEPRFTISLSVTVNEYLGLLWSMDGTHPGTKPDKGTIKKIASFRHRIIEEHDEWRRQHFKCAKSELK
jgi:hypothetical protein